jgi:hypothetical protein
MRRWAAFVAGVTCWFAFGASRGEPASSGLSLLPSERPALTPALLLLAQSGEPTPPGEPSKPGSAGPGAGEPTAGEPAKGAAGAGEPTAPGEPNKPGSAATPPGEPIETLKAKPKKDVSYGFGVLFRGIFVPEWFLGAFFDANTSLNSVALGGEFVRRKGNFDLVASINFGFYSPKDGNYLGKGKLPSVDTDYIQFRNLNLLAFDVAFLWHHDFTKWLSLVYGAGLGLGVVLGDIWRISDWEFCTKDNVKDLGACHPKLSSPYDPVDPSTWPYGNGEDTPGNPHVYREDGVWPVIPIVHLLVGVNFKISEQFSVRVDGGFHNAFYVGAAGQYFL